MPKSLFINGKTYVYDDSGNLSKTVDGDQTRNPAAFEPRGGTLKGTPGGNAARSNLTGDLVTNLATQLPLYLIPGEGAGMTMLKGAGSLLSGLGMDQLVNKVQGNDKSVGDSAADAGFNTAISLGMNHLIQNPPTVSAFDKAKGWGVRGIIGGLLNAMKGEPLIPEVPATTPVLHGKGGKWESNLDAFKAYKDYAKKKSILDIISNLAGFGVNSALDVNTDSNQGK